MKTIIQSPTAIGMAEFEWAKVFYATRVAHQH